MKIAEVSEQYGISVDTLRYYERVGLIPPVRRNGSGSGLIPLGKIDGDIEALNVPGPILVTIDVIK